MIKLEKTEVWGFEHAIRGMRNPMNSWGKSDSYEAVDCGKCGIVDREGVCVPKEHDCRPYLCYEIGKNDLDLMRRLIAGGQPHRKFLRQIFVAVDIIAPLYWWKEFDTYKVGTTANSCSTMHKIQEKEFTFADFSCEHIGDVPNCDPAYENAMECMIFALNEARHCFLDTKDKKYWWQMIQLLPTSYNQKRTVTMTYENLINMLEYRRGHKLDEWHDFCDWIVSLPYGNLLKEGIE